MAYTVVPTVVAGQKITATQGNKYAAGITELQQIATDGQVDVDTVGPTSGTTELTVTTVTLPAPGIAGRISAWGRLKWTQSVGTDTFIVRLVIGTTTVAYQLEAAAASPPPAALSAGADVDGLSAVDVKITIARNSGTGTATALDDQRSGLEILFVPNP